MVVPSLIPTRRFPDAVRSELQVAYARAWEALTQTHEVQMAGFVRRLQGRVSAEEALQRYPREVSVPLHMQETVRARALLALTPDERSAHGAASAEPWTLLRPDHLLDALRRRAQFVEDTTLTVRLAAAAADEAVAATHVRMALEVAQVLASVLPLDEALMHYIRSMELAPVPAQLVFQRAMATVAATDSLPALEAPDVPRLARPRRSIAPVLGLRALG
jgi:glucose/arabinose dehydrogenase